MIFITVGIICKNEEKYIGNLIKSLKKLDFDKSCYGIIVVDGNSTDSTVKIIKRNLRGSKIKHLILNEKDFGGGGHCFARNLVIRKAFKNSQYIAFVDADCIVRTDWLKKLYKKIENTNRKIAGVGGPRSVANTEDAMEKVINTYLTTFVGSGGNLAFWKGKRKYIHSIANYNAMYRYSILKRFKYDESLVNCDDIDINYRITKSGYRFLYAPEAGVLHAETGSLVKFMKKMFNYGRAAMKTSLKNHAVVRISIIAGILSVPLIPILFLSMLILPKFIITKSLVSLYVGLTTITFLDISNKTRVPQSLLVYILPIVQHMSYGLGNLYQLLTTQTKS